jgi:hypothetical protein
MHMHMDARVRDTRGVMRTFGDQPEISQEFHNKELDPHRNLERESPILNETHQLIGSMAWIVR